MDPELAWRSVPQLIAGAGVTLALVAQALVYGALLAVPVAFARLSRNPLLRLAAYLYMLFFRGTPLLVQIFLIYFGLGQFEFVRDSVAWPILREAWWCAIISLTLATAAYTAEIIRGAVLGVAKEQIEAARACGMSAGLTLRRIVFPQALRLGLGAYGNEVIMLLKGSALVSTITIMDLTGVANQIFYRTYDPFTPFIVAGAIYLVLVVAITRLLNRLEFRLGASARPLAARPGSPTAGAKTTE